MNPPETNPPETNKPSVLSSITENVSNIFSKPSDQPNVNPGIPNPPEENIASNPAIPSESNIEKSSEEPVIADIVTLSTKKSRKSRKSGKTNWPSKLSSEEKLLKKENSLMKRKSQKIHKDLHQIELDFNSLERNLNRDFSKAKKLISVVKAIARNSAK